MLKSQIKQKIFTNKRCKKIKLNFSNQNDKQIGAIDAYAAGQRFNERTTLKIPKYEENLTNSHDEIK